MSQHNKSCGGALLYVVLTRWHSFRLEEREKQWILHSDTSHHEALSRPLTARRQGGYCPVARRCQPNQCCLHGISATAVSSPGPRSQRQLQAEEHVLQSLVCAVSFPCSRSSWDHPAHLARGLAALWLKCLASILRFACSGGNP